MTELIGSETLKNGLIVEFRDKSNRYFGDYHRVRIEVFCRFSLGPELFCASARPQSECERAKALLGEELTFVRHLERMGVAGGRVEEVRRELIDSFAKSAFPYLEAPDFIQRLVARELEKRGHFPEPR